MQKETDKINDIANIIAYLDILTADDTFRDDRNAFNACGLSSEDMKDVKTFLQEQHQEIKDLTTMRGKNWYAHYIKKDKATLGENNKVAKTPRVTVKYSPEQQAWKVFIKPSGVRQLGMTKAEGGFKHVVTNGIELSLNNNKLALNKVVMIRAKSSDKEKNVMEQVVTEGSADIVKYVSSSNETEHRETVRQASYYYTDTYGGKESTELIDPDKIKDKTHDTIFQDLSDFVVQVGSQISAMHNQGSTHSDLKLENVLVDSVNQDGISRNKFTVIDPDEIKRDPNALGKHRYPETMTPGFTAISSYSKRTSQVLRGRGINIRDLPDLTMYKKKKRDERKVCGHMDDSYGFLVSMLDQIQLLGEKRELLCIGFIQKQLRILFEHCNTCQDSNDNEWNGPTVSSIKEAFGEFCKKNNYNDVYNNSLQTSEVIQKSPNAVGFHGNFQVIIKRRATILSWLASLTGELFSYFYQDTYSAKMSLDKLLQDLSTGNISSLQDVDTSVLDTATNAGWLALDEKKQLDDIFTKFTRSKQSSSNKTNSVSSQDPSDPSTENASDIITNINSLLTLKQDPEALKASVIMLCNKMTVDDMYTVALEEQAKKNLVSISKMVNYDPLTNILDGADIISNTLTDPYDMRAIEYMPYDHKKSKNKWERSYSDFKNSPIFRETCKKIATFNLDKDHPYFRRLQLLKVWNNLYNANMTPEDYERKCKTRTFASNNLMELSNQNTQQRHSRSSGGDNSEKPLWAKGSSNYRKG